MCIPLKGSVNIFRVSSAIFAFRVIFSTDGHDTFPFYLLFLMKTAVAWSIVTRNNFEFSHYWKTLSCQDMIYFSKWLLCQLYFRNSVTSLNFHFLSNVSVCTVEQRKNWLTQRKHQAFEAALLEKYKSSTLHHMKLKQPPGREGEKRLGY